MNNYVTLTLASLPTDVHAHLFAVLSGVSSSFAKQAMYQANINLLTADELAGITAELAAAKTKGAKKKLLINITFAVNKNTRKYGELAYLIANIDGEIRANAMLDMLKYGQVVNRLIMPLLPRFDFDDITITLTASEFVDACQRSRYITSPAVISALTEAGFEHAAIAKAMN